jgi:hypothetical protein
LPHKIIFITHTLSKQDFCTIKQTPDEAGTKKIEEIKNKLENMNPSHRNFMLDAITLFQKAQKQSTSCYPADLRRHVEGPNLKES